MLEQSSTLAKAAPVISGAMQKYHGVRIADCRGLFPKLLVVWHSDACRSMGKTPWFAGRCEQPAWNLERKGQSAAQRARRLDHVDGATVLPGHREITLREQVAKIE